MNSDMHSCTRDVKDEEKDVAKKKTEADLICRTVMQYFIKCYK